MAQSGPGFWEQVVFGPKGHPDRGKVWGPGGPPGFWESVFYPNGRPQPKPTGKLNKYGYLDTGEADDVQEAYARAVGSYENRNIDQEIAEWSRDPTGGSGNGSSKPATKLSSSDAISKAIAASVGDWRQPDPDNRSLWAAAGDQTAPEPAPPPPEQPYQPQGPLPGGGLPWQMMTPQQAGSVMAEGEKLPGFDLRHLGIGAPYKSAEMLRVPSPHGGATAGGNTFGGNRFGGNTFGGNRFGGNTSTSIAQGAGDTINSILGWNGKVYADGGRVNYGEPMRERYAEPYRGEPMRERYASPYLGEPMRERYAQPYRGEPMRTRAYGGRAYDAGGNVEAIGNLVGAFNMDTDKDKDKKQSGQPQKKPATPLPSLPNAPAQPVIAPPQMAAPAQVRPIDLVPGDTPQRAARGGYFAQGGSLRTHGGPIPTVDDYKRGKRPSMRNGRQEHFAWAMAIPMIASALGSMGGGGKEGGGGGGGAQMPQAPAQPHVAPPTMAAPAQQHEVDLLPGDEPDPQHAEMLHEQARGGRTGFMRGGYPELYNQPVRKGYFSTGGGGGSGGGNGRNYVSGDGQGDGRSDHIEALLSPGEYVMDAETTSLLGNGSNEAGARKFDKLRKSIRVHKGKQLAKGQFSPMAKKNAEEYLARDAISDGMRYAGR